MVFSDGIGISVFVFSRKRLSPTYVKESPEETCERSGSQISDLCPSEINGSIKGINICLIGDVAVGRLCRKIGSFGSTCENRAVDGSVSKKCITEIFFCYITIKTYSSVTDDLPVAVDVHVLGVHVVGSAVAGILGDHINGSSGNILCRKLLYDLSAELCTHGAFKSCDTPCKSGEGVAQITQFGVDRAECIGELSISNVVGVTENRREKQVSRTVLKLNFITGHYKSSIIS